MKFKTQNPEETSEVIVEITETPEEKKETKPSIDTLHRKRISAAFDIIRSAMNTIEDSFMYLSSNEREDND